MSFLSQGLTKGAYFMQVFAKQDNQMQTAYQHREGLGQKAPGSINQKVVKGVWPEAEIDFKTRQVTQASMDGSNLEFSRKK